jgi:hypothetical protein
VEELSRLAATNSDATNAVLGRALAASQPNYDMEDRLKNLLRYLAAHGHRADVLIYSQQLLNTLPGILGFYEEISGVLEASG